MTARMGELSVDPIALSFILDSTYARVCVLLSHLVSHNLVSVNCIEICHKDKKEKKKAQDTLP